MWVNGNKRPPPPDGLTLAAWLAQERIPAERVSTLVNDELVPRDDRAHCVLKDPDRIEILTLAGGG